MNFSLRARTARSVFRMLVALAAISTGLAGCNQASDNNPAINSPEQAPGSTLQPGTPDSPSTPTPAPTTPPNSNTLTIGVKYVAMKSQASETASPTQAEVVTLLQNMSNIWSQCDIAFKLDEYLTPVASDSGVNYYPANQSELQAMRSQFDNGHSALYVKTGTWNRSGNLGADGSNGFSTLPPANPQGTVFESWVATSTLLLSHETGHLIGGLDHTSDSTNLMNHYVSTSTTKLTSSQCTSARNTIKTYLSSWLR